MVLAAPAPFGAQQSCPLKYNEVFGKPLARNVDTLPSQQSHKEFEQGLAIALGELIKEPTPRGIRQCVKESIEIHDRN